MANSVLYVKCSIWVHGRYAKMKRVNLILTRGFVCGGYVEAMKGIVKPAEELIFYNQVEQVKSFCY